MYTTLLTAFLIGAPPQPVSSFAPVLHVKLIAPQSTTITLRPGLVDTRVYPGTATFAVRPGYTCRLALNGSPNNPTAAFHPTLEVRSSLFLPSNLRGQDYPAIVRITEEDMARVEAGGLVTKVIYLENPEFAEPTQSTTTQPLERDALRGEDPVDTARRNGRVLAILRLGSRTLTAQELMAEDVDGVLQQTGESLGPPAVPPTLPAQNFQTFDPKSGPRVPTEELVPDGGDTKLRIGIAPNGHLGNLDTTDTGAEFRYGTSPRRTTVSNRVCLFAPRFVTIRQDSLVANFHGALPPLAKVSASGLTLNRTRLPALDVNEVTPPMAVLTRISARGTRTKEGVHELDLTSGAALMASVEGVRIKAALVEPAGLIQYRDQCKPNEPLVLVKTADPREAQPGDTVTFTLKFINYGSRPARELTISDSLSPRLEYIPGTSCGDRPTVFTYQANESGSAILRWAINGELAAGQTGVVQFQVKVR